MSASDDLVRRVCLSLPHVEERLSHGHPGYFIARGKQFATYHDGHHDVPRPHMWCAAPRGAQESLVAQRPDRFFRPAYVGHRGWLGVYLDRDVDEREVEGLLIEAYRTVCPPRLLAEFDAGG